MPSDLGKKRKKPSLMKFEYYHVELEENLQNRD